LKETEYLEDLDINWTTILKQILRTQDGREWTGFVRHLVGSFEGGNEHSNLVECGEFLAWLRTC